jgi:hypothetical protein
MSGYRSGWFWRIITTLAEKSDRKVGWDELPTPLGLGVLVGLRTKLRQKNLYDTRSLPSVDAPAAPPAEASQRTRRMPDGSWNDLEDPAMGMAGSRFGRNIPLDKIAPAGREDVLGSPNPREISRRLFTRHELIAVEAGNSLMAAWLQFMIHYWFSHGKSPKDDPWVIDLDDDDPFPQKPMLIMRTMDDPTRPPGSRAPQTRINVLTHWWDGSQIYGDSVEAAAMRRSGVGGKLRVNDDGSLPWPKDPGYDPSQVPGFWAGMAMLTTLFTREHNSICDRLTQSFPGWGDEELFQRARLINAALLAKIHTVDWTPAVISHPTTIVALRANWFGLAGERVHKLLGRVSPSEVISGIPGAKADHYGVPYALTEEFAAVYRMHPLIRDDWSIRRADDDLPIGESDLTFAELTGPSALKLLDTVSMTDLLYSFGTLPPGVVTMHNYPKHMQEFLRPDGNVMDLAAADIVRSREMGIPRYNEFRRLLHLAPAKTFDDLTDNPTWAREISEVYGGDIEKVDLQVGMYAEPLPENFAFSDTAFRIFVLMASRRLNSDRFFTDYYTPAVYTEPGLAWIEENSMKTVLLRHYPDLRPSLEQVPNAFFAWRRSGS